MKHIKKMFALFLATVMVFCFSTTAFATETNSIPENATKHTIEVTVAPDGTIEDVENGGASTYIWNQGNYNVYGDKTYTAQFNVSDRYFAYEYSATGNTSGSYKVELLFGPTLSMVAAGSSTVNDGTHKIDWIDLGTTPYNYLFCITNYTGSTINVAITYYSWN